MSEVGFEPAAEREGPKGEGGIGKEKEEVVRGG